jgi:quinol monooxygenase YgiN
MPCAHPGIRGAMTSTSTSSTATVTVTKGLLVRLEAKTGKEDDVERFLTEARPLVEREPKTSAWFAVRFGRGEFGIFDVFPDESGRDAHLHGAVATALAQRGAELFDEAPRIERLDVLAHKLPLRPPTEPVRKGLLLSFEPKSEHEDDAAQFLRDARGFVEEEEGTVAWFGIKFDDGRYGIFDVFPDNRSRLAHLTGRVPRELTKRALTLLGSLPDMDKCDVLSAKLGE